MLKDSSFVGGEGLDSVVSGSVVFGHPKATDQMDKNGQPDGTTTAVQESPTISERDSDTGDSAVRTVVDSEQVVR